MLYNSKWYNDTDDKRFDKIATSTLEMGILLSLMVGIFCYKNDIGILLSIIISIIGTSFSILFYFVFKGISLILKMLKDQSENSKV